MENELSKKFLKKIEDIYSKEELNIILAGFRVKKRNVVFRVNTLKSNNLEIENYLSSLGLSFEKINYLENGYRLLNGSEKDLWFLDVFFLGKIYLQGISSQIIGELIRKYIHNYNIKCLDLAASPGGKTSHLSAILENRGEIVANELNTIRFEKLKFTIKRQGVKNISLIKGDARNLKDIYSSEYFDLVIADLPCSAEGRINFNDKKTFHFLDNISLNKRNYSLQKDILKNTIHLLKTNGILIYSTCSLDPNENEGIVHFLLSNYKNLELLDISSVFDNTSISKYIKQGINKYSKYVYRNEVKKSIRILPSIETEGFFLAVFIKIQSF